MKYQERLELHKQLITHITKGEFSKYLDVLEKYCKKLRSFPTELRNVNPEIKPLLWCACENHDITAISILLSALKTIPEVDFYYNRQHILEMVFNLKIAEQERQHIFFLVISNIKPKRNKEPSIPKRVKDYIIERDMSEEKFYSQAVKKLATDTAMEDNGILFFSSKKKKKNIKVSEIKGMIDAIELLMLDFIKKCKLFKSSNTTDDIIAHVLCHMQEIADPTTRFDYHLTIDQSEFKLLLSDILEKIELLYTHVTQRVSILDIYIKSEENTNFPSTHADFIQQFCWFSDLEHPEELRKCLDQFKKDFVWHKSTYTPYEDYIGKNTGNKFLKLSL